MIPVPPNNSAKTYVEEEIGSQSLLTAMNKFVGAVHKMDNVIMVPSRLMDMKPEPCNSLISSSSQEENGDSQQVKTPDVLAHKEIDLRSCYRLLNAIKAELVRGTPDDDGDNELDEPSRKAALTFRMHLNGLFTTLHQLTDCADYLTDTYQKSLDSEQQENTNAWSQTVRL